MGAVLMVLVLQAQAGWVYDLFSPSWRGTNASTYQTWNFSTSAQSNIAPASVTNPYGSPFADIGLGNLSDGYFSGTSPGTGSFSNYWDLGGSGGIIALTIPATPGPQQLISVQVAYFRNPPQPPNIFIPGATLLGTQYATLETVSVGGPWELVGTTWLIDPGSPMTDYIWITSGSMGSVINSIVVDTMVVPEPSALSLLALGGAIVLSALRRRR